MSSDSDSEGNLQVDLSEVKIEQESEDDNSRDPLSLEQTSSSKDKTEGCEMYADTASSSCDPVSPGEKTKADVIDDPVSASQLMPQHNVPTLIGLLGKHDSLLGKRPATPTTSSKVKLPFPRLYEDIDDDRERKKYTCLRCGFMTNLDNELRDHMTLLHPEGLREEVPKKVHKDPITKTFKCDVCNKYFPHTDMLEKHKAYEHQNNQNTIKIKILLPQPKEIIIPQQKTPVPKKIFPSPAVSKPASKKEVETETKEKSKGKTTLSCGECDYTTNYASSLKAHSLRHAALSEEKPFSCDRCDYKASDIKLLKRHKKINHIAFSEDKPFSCDRCNYKTTVLKLLKRHKKRNHVGIERCDSTTEEREAVGKEDAATSVDFISDKNETRLFITGDS